MPDIDAVIVPYGGGALTTGVASIMKECSNGRVKVYGSEPETVPKHEFIDSEFDIHCVGG